MFYDNILIYTHLFILQILSTLVSESTGECLVVSRNRFCNTLSFTFSLHFLHFSSLYFFSTLTNFTCYFHTLFSLFILTLSSHSFFPFYFFFSFLNRAISLHLYSLLSCSNFSPRSLTTFVLYFFFTYSTMCTFTSVFSFYFLNSILLVLEVIKSENELHCQNQDSYQTKATKDYGLSVYTFIIKIVHYK